MDMIQQDHIGIGIGVIHSDHIGIGMVVSVEPYSLNISFIEKNAYRSITCTVGFLDR